MNIQALQKGAKIIEAIENYALAEANTASPANLNAQSKDYFYSDQNFWEEILHEPERFWRQKVTLNRFVVSEWISRVPGLYWDNASESIREHSNADISIKSKEWTILKPPGKSRKVLGGVGTLLLPPSDEGKVLMSVSASCNASVGIPVLVYPDVIDRLKLKQGDLVDIIEAKWQPMDLQWAKQFASTEKIPRGYIVIDKTEKIRVRRDNLPVVYQPFSIMEYECQDALLYDFVFVTVDSKVKNADKEVSKFFEEYAKQEGRNGSYLINPNVVHPIFEAKYISPTDLQGSTERAQLKLLYERIRGACFSDISLELLMIRIPQYYQSSTSIKRLAKLVGLSPAQLADDSAAAMSAQLIAKSIEKGVTEQLIDRLATEYPQIFK